MSHKPIRVVIRQPLHSLIKDWAELLGIDDFGEVVNYLLLDMKRAGYQPTGAASVETPAQRNQTSNESSAISDLAGLF